MMYLDDFLKLGFKIKETADDVHSSRRLLPGEPEYEAIQLECFRLNIETLCGNIWDQAQRFAQQNNCFINWIGEKGKTFEYAACSINEVMSSATLQLGELYIYIEFNTKTDLIYKVRDATYYYGHSWTSDLYIRDRESDPHTPMSLLSGLYNSREKNVKRTRGHYNGELKKLHAEYRDALKLSKQGMSDLEKLLTNNN